MDTYLYSPRGGFPCVTHVGSGRDDVGTGCSLCSCVPQGAQCDLPSPVWAALWHRRRVWAAWRGRPRVPPDGPLRRPSSASLVEVHWKRSWAPASRRKASEASVKCIFHVQVYETCIATPGCANVHPPTKRINLIFQLLLESTQKVPGTVGVKLSLATK